MRLNPVSVVTLERKVLPREGVTLPSGQHLPAGTWLGVPVVGVHSDESIYPDAASYKPFRFCSRKPDGKPEDGNAAAANTTQMTSTGLVNATDTFLPFGAGKFAWYVYSPMENIGADMYVLPYPVPAAGWLPTL